MVAAAKILSTTGSSLRLLPGEVSPAVGVSESLATLAVNAEKAALALVPPRSQWRQYVRFHLDKVVPPELQDQVASRSPLYNQTLAGNFRHSIEAATGDVPGNVSKNLETIRRAQQRERDFLLDTCEHWDRRFYKSGFMDRHYLTAIRQSPEVHSHMAYFRKLERQVQPVVNDLTAELKIPTVRVEMTPILKSLGANPKGSYLVKVNPDHFVAPNYNLASTIYHEVGHVEQSAVMVHKLADDLSIGAKASPAQIAELTQQWAARFGGKKPPPLHAKFVEEVIKLRSGRPLSPEQAARAEELFTAKKGIPYRSLDEIAQLKDDQLMEAIRIRSTMHEIESHAVANLVKNADFAG